MINTQNRRDRDSYIRYKKEVLLNSPKTIKRDNTHLSHILNWAGDKLLTQGASIRPTFPAYLADQTELAPSTVQRTLDVSQGFLRWCVEHYPNRYPHKRISKWIETLHARNLSQEPKTRSIFTYSDIEAILAVPTRDGTLTSFRDQAGIAFLFASGMRIDAFVSMPINCIDFGTSPPTVLQWPTRGVRTKFNKAGTTMLAPIPALMDLIKKWDVLVRSTLSETALWYACLTTDGTDLLGKELASNSRDQQLRQGLKRLCERASIPYRNPHMLRHGHAVYVKSHSTHPSRDDAIAYNLMHGPQNVTQVYTAATEEIAREVYSSLDKTVPDTAELKMEALLRKVIHEELKEHLP